MPFNVRKELTLPITVGDVADIEDDREEGDSDAPLTLAHPAWIGNNEGKTRVALPLEIISQYSIERDGKGNVSNRNVESRGGASVAKSVWCKPLSKVPHEVIFSIALSDSESKTSSQILDDRLGAGRASTTNKRSY